MISLYNIDQTRVRNGTGQPQLQFVARRRRVRLVRAGQDMRATRSVMCTASEAFERMEKAYDIAVLSIALLIRLSPCIGVSYPRAYEHFLKSLYTKTSTAGAMTMRSLRLNLSTFHC